MNTVIVSGIGRSGTGYVAEVLQRCDLRVTHKGMFKGGFPADPPTRKALDKLNVNVEVSGFAMGHLCEPEFRDLPVVLAVRHPLDWLASWQSKNYALDYINKHLGTVHQSRRERDGDWIFPTPQKTLLGAQLSIWTQWNLAVAERAVFFFQVEHIHQVDVEAIALLADVHSRLPFAALAKRIFQVPRNVNSVGKVRKRYSWSELRVDEDPLVMGAYRLARKFGYH